MFLSRYTSCLLRPDDLGKDIGSLCFRACLSILPVHPKGGGAKVVTSYAGMMPEYAGSLGYDVAPRFDWDRPHVVTALSVRREAASRLSYSPIFGYRVGVHAKMERDGMLRVILPGVPNFPAPAALSMSLIACLFPSKAWYCFHCCFS